MAAHLGAFKFRDCGPALNSGVTDSGIAYLQGDGRKIAIDTFPDKTSRDDWLPTGRSFGAVPFAEADTWVAYASTNPDTGGC